MSTKVYNGYKFKSGTTFQEIQEKYLNLKDTDFYKQVQEFINTLNASLYINCLDKNITNEISAYWEKNKVYEDFLYQQYLGYRTVGDFDCSITFYCHSDGNIYSRVFSENRFICDYIVNYFELEEFYYFNNSDKPNEISDSEWDERSDIWDLYEPTFFIEIISPKSLKLDFHPFFRENNLYNKEVRYKIFINENIELIIEKLNIKVPEIKGTYKKSLWYQERINEVLNDSCPEFLKSNLKNQIFNNLQEINANNYLDLKSKVII